MLLLVSPSLTSSMISTKDYCALGVLDILGRNYRPHGLSSILDPRVGRIYSFYPGHKDEAKVYLLTKSVARRVEKMDTDSLTPDAVLFDIKSTR